MWVAEGHSTYCVRLLLHARNSFIDLSFCFSRNYSNPIKAAGLKPDSRCSKLTPNIKHEKIRKDLFGLNRCSRRNRLIKHYKNYQLLLRVWVNLNVPTFPIFYHQICYRYGSEKWNLHFFLKKKLSNCWREKILKPLFHFY